MVEAEVEPESSRALWEQLTALVESGDEELVRGFVSQLAPVDVVRSVANIDEASRAALLSMLEPARAADVIEHLPDVQASDALGHIEPETAARILAELPSNARADLIGEIVEADADAILAHLPEEKAAELRTLAAYSEGTAGALMVTELVHLPAAWTVSRIVDDLRRNAEEYSGYEVQYIYLQDDEGRLAGVARLRDLVLSSKSTVVLDIATRDPHWVPVDADVRELAHFFDDHRFFAAPVLDAERRLLGIVRRSAVKEAETENSDETFRQTQGIVGGEELRTMPVLLRSKRRLSWLSVNIVLNVLAASVIAMHQDTLQSVIALAVFLPIISDMSGCSGNQAVAVSLRELTLGVTRPGDLLRVLSQEVRVGLLNGLALGALIALVAWGWQGNAWLGAVVGLALALNTVIAVSVGGLVPLVLQATGRDPALASGPILTTVTDMCGFLAVLTIASTVLERLA